MNRLPEGLTGRDDVADVHIAFYCRTLFVGTVEPAEIYSKCHGVFYNRRYDSYTTRICV